MKERYKTPFELANELLVSSKPSELLKEQAKGSPSLDDLITNEIDIRQTGHNGRQ